MLIPLLVMAGAFTSYFIAVVILRLRTEIAQRKIQTLRFSVAGDGATG